MEVPLNEQWYSKKDMDLLQEKTAKMYLYIFQLLCAMDSRLLKKVRQ